MPEGPEVTIIKEDLNIMFQGKIISEFNMLSSGKYSEKVPILGNTDLYRRYQQKVPDKHYIKYIETPNIKEPIRDLSGEEFINPLGNPESGYKLYKEMLDNPRRKNEIWQKRFREENCEKLSTIENEDRHISYNDEHGFGNPLDYQENIKNKGRGMPITYR